MGTGMRQLDISSRNSLKMENFYIKYTLYIDNIYMKHGDSYNI